MKLILVRHAEAVNVGEAQAINDFDRSLTDLGRTQAEALAKALAGLNVRPGLVLTSPYLRAVQTAEPLAATLTPGVIPQLNDFLRLEEVKPRKLAKQISELGLSTVVLVGHMPDMSRLAGWILGCSSGTIAFDKSAAALIACGKTIEKGSGELHWLATPDWFLHTTSI